jgi:hypothetical protein
MRSFITMNFRLSEWSWYAATMNSSERAPMTSIDLSRQETSDGKH